MLQDKLDKDIASRPTPDELVKKGILQRELSPVISRPKLIVKPGKGRPREFNERTPKSEWLRSGCYERDCSLYISPLLGLDG